jgi:acetylglutamate kinase
MTGTDREIIVVKIGGRAASGEEALRDLARDIAAARDAWSFFVVHGGGAEVSRVTKIFGLQPVFKDGVRQTSPAEMEIVDMALAGKMNTGIVRIFEALGVPAVGLSGCDGGFFTGRSIDPEAGSRTGRVTHVEPRAALLLAGAGYVPVIASTSMDLAGEALNINADEAAREIARAVRAKALVYLSDIPGILKDGQCIARMNAGEAEKEIAAGVITGGMIPKVRSALEAVKSGAGSVVIGEFTRRGDLDRLLNRESGTTITE